MEAHQQPSSEEGEAHPPTATPAPRVTIEVDYDGRISLAMQQNDVPVVKLVRITNSGNDPLEGLELTAWIDRDLAPPVDHRLARLASGETWTLEGFGLQLDPAGLSKQEERQAAVLHVEARVSGDGDEAVLCHEELPLQALPHDAWGGLNTLPEILAAFVQPGQTAVEQVIDRVRFLREPDPDASQALGYDSENSPHVRRVAEGIYLALQERGVGCAPAPAGFAFEGQRISPPERILEQRLGTCLDLALLHAACLERCGLHPLILVLDGHAFTAVWTTETCFSEPAMDDAASVRKRIHLDEILAFDSAAITTKPATAFDDACRTALRNLEDSNRFLCAVDIRAARKLRVRPLPLASDRTAPLPATDGTVRNLTELQASEATLTSAKDNPSPRDETRLPTPPDVPVAPEAPNTVAPDTVALQEESAEGPTSRLETWKRKLLDLSLRNRLLNFRETKKTVPLLGKELGALEDALSSGRSFSILARPELLDTDPTPPTSAGQAPTAQGVGGSPEPHAPPAEPDPLGTFLLAERKDSRLRTSLSEAQTDAHLLNVYRMARNDLDETGANTLFLAVGFLSWFETESSPKERLAPILLLPLKLVRKSVQEGFRVRLADDDPRINITLLEKLATDYNLDTTGLDALPGDDTGLDVENILQGFRRVIRDMKRWDVKEQVAIGLFSFSTFLMWKDLQEHTDKLLESRVVQHLVENPGEPFEGDDALPEPRSLDDERAAIDTLCPLDADSSQLAAIFAAHDGRTFVLQGPPGTGKSQTITNLMAHAIGHGRRVLFVAEKRAALNVVHDRLEKVGLASACLEIHSNKANKREVLGQIRAALEDTGSRMPPDWERLTGHLENHRSALNSYVRALHQRQLCGRSYFDALSGLVGLKEKPRIELELGDPLAMESERLKQLQERLDELATAAQGVTPIASHPLRAIQVDEWRASVSRALETACARLQEAAREVDEACCAARTLLGCESAAPCTWSANGLEVVATLCRLLLESPQPERELLTIADWVEVKPRLEGAIECGRRRDAAEAQLLERFTESFLKEDPATWLARWQRATTSMFPFSWFRQRSAKRDLGRFAVGGVPAAPLIAESLETLRVFHEQVAALVAVEAELSATFGRHWKTGRPDWSELTRQIEWVDRARALLLRLREMGPSDAGSIEERFLSLATETSSTAFDTETRGPTLERVLEAWNHLAEAKREADSTLELNRVLAWGAPAEANHLDAVRAWGSTAAEHRGALRNWCHWRRSRALASEDGVGTLVAAAEAGTVPPEEFRDVFERAFLERLSGAIEDTSDLLRRFNSLEHERRIEKFRQLDQQLLTLSRDVIRARLEKRIPAVSDETSGKSEVGILARQLKLKRRHLSIRQLFESLPNLLPRLKPCLLMSPLSVAQYLSPDYPKADLVIFDEASQIPVWDAIGALARGKAAVVVGDSKQLPPTSFFRRQDGDDDEVDDDVVQDLESILDECEASGLRVLHLNWHYRSRHESLIAFSNHHYYDNRLHTFPSSAREVAGLGVSLRHFPDAVYDKGKSATNRIEAEAVCAEVVRRLQGQLDLEAPRSIGVVAFSQAQQTLIEDLLDAARREHPEIEPFFRDEAPEPVLVKNLENVQGDERDVIFFSICYGPDSNRKVSMNFGPLNRQGGERRLNVAITRARRELVVFTSLTPDQIDLRRTRALGVEHLKIFLDYAKRGAHAISQPVEAGPGARPGFESTLEKEVREALQSSGHQVANQVGSSGYRVDLAVIDPKTPGRYLLGIECDGATYHVAATARDRDRLRHAVLESLGWRLHRIWSSDWWNDPQGELAKAEKAIEDATRQAPLPSDDEPPRDGETPPPGDTVVPAPEERNDTEATAVETTPVETTPVEETPAEETQPEMGATRSAGGLSDTDRDAVPNSPPPTAAADEESLRHTYPMRPPPAALGSPEEFYSPAALASVSAQVQAFVETEAPFAFGVLCRRVVTAWGLEKVGPRARDRVQLALVAIPEGIRPVVRGDFVWSAEQDPNTLRFFRVPDPADPEPRRAQEIPSEEVAGAAAYVLDRQVALPLEELEREAARLFGFTRRGKQVTAKMQAGIRLLQERGGCVIQADSVTASV